MYEERTCSECGRPIHGRSDKKFCSDACRNSHNNKVTAPATNYVRNVNNTLAKNRRVLADLLAQDKINLHKDELWKKGFDFDFYTSSLTTPVGEVYLYCYDLGYQLLDEGTVRLVEREHDDSRRVERGT